MGKSYTEGHLMHISLDIFSKEEMYCLDSKSPGRVENRVIQNYLLVSSINNYYLNLEISSGYGGKN